MHQSITAVLTSCLLAVPAFAGVVEYDIDTGHSAAQFSVRHMMVSNVRGAFSKVTGTVKFDDKDVTKSSVEATIDVSTVNTNDAQRDGHLKSPDFFDVGKFPTMTFKSKKVTGAAGKLSVVGDLTLHGVTKEVTLDVEGPSPEAKDPWGNLRRGLAATAKLNRKDFGLAWNKALETGGVAVGEEVTITIDAELMAKKAPAAPPAAPPAKK